MERRAYAVLECGSPRKERTAVASDARAIAGLKGEVTPVGTRVDQLVAELNRAIAEANRFIADLEPGDG
jgi:hypothetical protein